MKREFFLNVLFLLFANFIVKVFYLLVIDVSVQNTVGTSTYGEYFAIFNFCYLFQIFADLGLQNYNSQAAAKDPQYIKKNIAKLLGTKFLLSLLFLSILLIFAWIIGYIHSHPRLLCLVCIQFLLVSIILFLRTNVSASKFYRFDSFISILDKLILIFLLAYLLWYYTSQSSIFNIHWFVLSQIFASTMTLFAIILFHLRNIGPFLFKVDFSASREILNKSWPFGLIILLMTFYTRMDGVMLERLLDDNGYQAGTYAAAYRIIDGCNMIGFLFAGLLIPMFASQLGQKNDIKPLFDFALRLMLVIAVTISISLFFYSENIIFALYTDASPQHTDSLKILALGFLFISIAYIFGSLINANASVKDLTGFIIISIVINFTANYILIPEYGATGAAIATLCTQGFALLGHIYVTKKLFGVHLSKILLQFLILIVVASVCQFSLARYSTLPWIYNFLLAMMCTGIFSILIGLVRASEIQLLTGSRL